MSLPAMEIKATILQFPSMKRLWEFQKHARLRSFEFFTDSKTLHAVLTEDQIWDALLSFQGKEKESKKAA
jgi:hypothetical protein